MPVAQWHYPFENQEVWERQAGRLHREAIDEPPAGSTRAVSTLLFDRPAFKNVLCLGRILAEDDVK